MDKQQDHPRYLTRLYMTGSALLLLAIGISSAQALTNAEDAGNPLPESGVQSKASEVRPLYNETVHGTLSESGGTMNQSDLDPVGTSSASRTEVSVRSDDAATTVTVNGDTHTVPSDEPVTQSYQSDDGNTRVDISVDNDSTDGTSGQRSRLRVNMHSSSTSTRSTESVRSSP